MSGNGFDTNKIALSSVKPGEEAERSAVRGVKGLGLALAAMAVCVSGSAMALPLPGYYSDAPSRTRNAAEMAESLEAQQDLYDYGACLAEARRSQVERFLASEPFSRSAKSITRQLKMTACLDAGAVEFDSEAIRGPFYQALYRSEFQVAPAIDLSKAPTLDYSSYEHGGGKASEIFVNLRRFGDCVVRQDQESVRALAFSEVGSEQELAAMRNLKPEMAACIAPGDSIKLMPSLVRSVLNEVLYRLTVASAGRPMGIDRK